MTTGTHPPRSAHEPGTNHPNRWAILAVCCTGLFLLVSSLSSLNVALPSIQADTGATNSELQWIVDAYAVVFGGLLLTGGAIGDRLGRRPSLLIGFGILLVGGVLGIVAGTVGVIIAARVVAGFGAALMMPATLSTLTEVFAPADQPTAIATWSGIAGAGGAFGPALGGWLLTVSSWNAVFAASAVIAAIGFVGTAWVVPNLPVAPSSPLDLLGAGLSTAAIGLGLAAIIAAPDHAGDWSTWALAASAVAAGLAFFRHQRRSSAPMLPLEVLAPPRVRAGLATLLLAAIGFAGVLFVGALLLQLGWGESALATGLLLMPIGAAELVASAMSPRLCGRLGTNRVITAGCALMAVGYVAMAATPVGMRVRATAEVVSVEGRTIRFRVRAEDEHDLIGEGTHERVVVNLARFDERVREKAARGTHPKG